MLTMVKQMLHPSNINYAKHNFCWVQKKKKEQFEESNQTEESIYILFDGPWTSVVSYFWF